MIKRLLPGSFRVNYRLRMEEGVVQAGCFQEIQ
jgi:hypothetical protein